MKPGPQELQTAAAAVAAIYLSADFGTAKAASDWQWAAQDAGGAVAAAITQGISPDYIMVGVASGQSAKSRMTKLLKVKKLTEIQQNALNALWDLVQDALQTLGELAAASSPTAQDEIDALAAAWSGQQSPPTGDGWYAPVAPTLVMPAGAPEETQQMGGITDTLVGIAESEGATDEEIGYLEAVGDVAEAAASEAIGAAQQTPGLGKVGQQLYSAAVQGIATATAIVAAAGAKEVTVAWAAASLPVAVSMAQGAVGMLGDLKASYGSALKGPALTLVTKAQTDAATVLGQAQEGAKQAASALASAGTSAGARMKGIKIAVPEIVPVLPMPDGTVVPAPDDAPPPAPAAKAAPGVAAMVGLGGLLWLARLFG